MPSTENKHSQLANLTRDSLKTQLDTSLADKVLWDAGVTMNRTNAVPLDYHSAVFKDASDTTAEAAAEKAAEKPIAYPGQLLTVVEDNEVTPFIVQTNTHERIVKTYTEDNELKDSVKVYPIVEQLAYKSYIDNITTDLKHTIGSLNGIMNFRGTFESFAAAETWAASETVDINTGKGVAFVPGDIIVITGGAETGATPDPETEGKPGMEYVCGGYRTDGTVIWQELGFGSQITTFIGGDTGLVLPDKLTVGGGQKTAATLVDYITESDTAITNFVGTESSDGSLTVPTTYPYNLPTNHGFEDKELKTVLGYTKAADLSISNRMEGILDAERKARRTTDIEIAEFIGSTISIETTEGSNEGKTNGSLKVPGVHFDADATKLKAYEDTVFGYVQEGDTKLATLIGAKTAADIKEKKLPDAKVATSDTIIEYIQDSDKTITTFIGSEDQTGFKLPAVLPDKETERDTTNTTTVLKYIQAADDNIIDVIGLEQGGTTSKTDNSTKIVTFSKATGETIAERLTDSNIQIENLNKFVGYQAAYEKEDLETRITGLDNLTEKASDCLIFEELDGINAGRCVVIGMETCLDTVIYVPRKDSKGNLVTAIEAGAFSGQPNIKKVVLPESITSIGNAAFSGCINLTEINIPMGVEQIGANAFVGCTQLKEIYIPKTCTSLGATAFKGCSNLSKVIFAPESPIEKISGYTFADCSSLTKIECPLALLEIEGYTFNNCIALTTILLSSSLKNIAQDAFKGCSNLSEIYYTGIEEEWQQITIADLDDTNAPIDRATKIYNFAPEKYSLNLKLDNTTSTLSETLNKKIDDISIRSSEGKGSIKINDIEHNQALVDYSFAGGIGTIANETPGQFVAGTYNTSFVPPEDKPEVKALYVIGNGTDDDNRANAVVVRTDGITELQGLHVYGDIEYEGDLAFDNLKARSVKSDRLEIAGDIIAENINLSAKVFNAAEANFEKAIAPTLALGTADKQLATTAFVQNAINDLKRILQESQPVEISKIEVKLAGASKSLNLSSVQQVTDTITQFTVAIIVSSEVKNDIQLYINNQAVQTTWDKNGLTYTSPVINYDLLNICGTHALKIIVKNLQETQATTKTVNINVGRTIYFGSIPVNSVDAPDQPVLSRPYTASILQEYGFTSEIRLDGSRELSSTGQYAHYKITDPGATERIFCYLVPYVCDANNKVVFKIPNPDTDFKVRLGALQMVARHVTVDSQPYILYYPEQNPGESLDVNIYASIEDTKYTFS